MSARLPSAMLLRFSLLPFIEIKGGEQFVNNGPQQTPL